MAAYEQALHLDSNRSEIQEYRGVALHALYRYDEALQAFERAIQLNPENTSAYIRKGNLLLESNPPRFDEAQEAYTQAIRLDPQLGGTYQIRDDEQDELQNHETQELLDEQRNSPDLEKTQKLLHGKKIEFEM